jgi:hypothetical protein
LNMTLWKIAARTPRKISRSPNFVTIRVSHHDVAPGSRRGIIF